VQIFKGLGTNTEFLPRGCCVLFIHCFVFHGFLRNPVVFLASSEEAGCVELPLEKWERFLERVFVLHVLPGFSEGNGVLPN